MLLDLEFVIALRTFLERGGNVLFVIGGVTFVMWVLILERFWYFRWVLPRDAAEVVVIGKATSSLGQPSQQSGPWSNVNPVM